MSAPAETAPTEASEVFASFVTTYKRPGLLKKMIGLLLDQSYPPDYVLVVDNAASETDDAVDVVAEFPDDRVGYHPMPSNTGSAGGAAAGMRELFARGYDWVHWGDDDDPPQTPDLLERLMELASSSSVPQPVGAVCAFGERWDWKRGRPVRLPDEALEGVLEIDYAPGNGHAIVSKRAVEKVGLPDARLFFGRIDPEFSLRLRRGGYKILMPGDLSYEIRKLVGHLGTTRSRTLAPKYEQHEIWREYYARRNYIHMMRDTFDRPDLAYREALKCIVKMLASWTKGRQYGSKYNRLIARALFDGFRGRLGRPVPPESKPEPKITKIKAKSR